MCHHFRRSKPDFFRELKRGPHTQPRKDAARELILGMRKQNLSIYDIESALKTQHTPLSTTAIWEILHEEGFARLPRRQDAERPSTLLPTAADVADHRKFSLAPRRFPTQLGGLFLFLPWLADCDLPGLVRQAGYPGSKMIPAPQAWLSLLGLKLSSTERKSHVMDLVFDQGLALFAGLNVVPKTTCLETYSHRFSPQMNETLRKLWIGVLRQRKLLKGESFNLDFHSIPFFGADESVERHYLSKRSRSQKSILVFLAQDAESHVFCYSKADLLKRDQADAVLDFVKFWKTAYGELPPELVFDSKLTTYAKLNQMGITFMTLRRRSPAILREVANTPQSAWRTVHLDVPHRMYQTPKVIDQQVSLRDDAVQFFHLDALSSAVRLKIDFDVTLTEVASGLYRMLGRRLAGYESAQSRQLFRHFLNTPAEVEITDKRAEVTLPKRVHNPLLLAAGFGQGSTPIPWWDGRPLALRFR
ncbi:MAG: hypothetical protein HY822_07860 [Acidobacteria bacterium]|nr:hypothetical protein [Acidobacteriota bacterium]